MTCHLEARRRDGVLRYRVWSTVSDTYDWSGEHPEGMLEREVTAYMAPRWHADGVARRIMHLRNGRDECGGAADLAAPWSDEACGWCLDVHARDGRDCKDGWSR